MRSIKTKTSWGYINRKNKPTLNVQATCDSKEMFTSVDVSWPGSVHDARIWKNSPVREVMRTTRNTVLIGDDGYGLEPWLMTPFSVLDNESESKFNKLLKKERVVIERCFGQLKRRFPILQYVCRVKLEKVPKIIVACVVLHNIAKSLGDPDFEHDEDILEEDEDLGDIAADAEIRGNLRHEGQAVRRNLAEIISQLI
ncbi:putative nuclease HARBI1 [Macrosteles quadrilineatus]|uniref:putative nuclease HARBI1 n=1 Tax=Macrosteles quadrilineatus TaxID=74068 RepID=UPI0023E1FD24|nr:putative nuclease HARBI1 [Macrosteles quadrilineatus]